MNINLLSQNYEVRRLNKTDINIIYELSCKNTTFYDYHPPFVTKESIAEDIAALPPQKTYKDKYYIGLFENHTLVCIIDLILDHPTKGTAFIGLFMLDTHYHNQGIGSSIFKEVCVYLKSIGYKKIRLGVDKGNPQSNAFGLKINLKLLMKKNISLWNLIYPNNNFFIKLLVIKDSFT